MDNVNALSKQHGIDKNKIRNRFKKTKSSYDKNAEVQKYIVDRLDELLSLFVGAFNGDILEIGCGTGNLTEKLCNRFIVNKIYVNDLVDELCESTAQRFNVGHIAGDIESLSLTKKYDMLVSSSVFQWFESPEITIPNFANVMNDKAYLVFSTFGPGNMKEIKGTTGLGLFYRDMDKLKSILSDRFDIIHCEKREDVLMFETPTNVLKHLKYTGVNAVSSSLFWTKSDLLNFSESYEKFKSGGTYPLTYESYFFVCRKKTVSE